MRANTINDVQPKAAMTPDEVARWNELPADEQLARLRSALQRGIDVGLAGVTMDRIWAKSALVIARTPSDKNRCNRSRSKRIQHTACAARSIEVDAVRRHGAAASRGPSVGPKTRSLGDPRARIRSA